MAGKHGWNLHQNYLEVVLGAVSNHAFVVRHTLQIIASPEVGEISGDVFCHEGIALNVEKHYEIRRVGNREEARTTEYSYHARYDKGGDILRYDNVPDHKHPTPHHKHDFRSGSSKVSHIGRNWPHLSEVLDELREMAWGKGSND